MALPNLNMSFSPFAILTAEEMNDLVENIESLADGSGFDDGALAQIGGSWTSWTPVWGNVTGGTLQYAKYAKISKTVHFRVRYTLGSAGVSGDVTMSLPFTGDSDYAVVGNTDPVGNALLREAGTAGYIGVVFMATPTTITVRAMTLSSSSYVLYSTINALTPFTWASGDEIYVEGTYQAA